MTQTQTQTTKSKPLPQSSTKIERCPSCYKVLCHREHIGEKELLHIKHKGFECWVPESIIKCMSCKKKYWVNSIAGVINEVLINGK